MYAVQKPIVRNGLANGRRLWGGIVGGHLFNKKNRVWIKRASKSSRQWVRRFGRVVDIPFADSAAVFSRDFFANGSHFTVFDFVTSEQNGVSGVALSGIPAF